MKVEGCGTVPKILLVEDNQAAVVKIRQFIENIDTALELLTCKEAGAAYILAQKQKCPCRIRFYIFFPCWWNQSLFRAVFWPCSEIKRI